MSDRPLQPPPPHRGGGPDYSTNYHNEGRDESYYGTGRQRGRTPSPEPRRSQERDGYREYESRARDRSGRRYSPGREGYREPPRRPPDEMRTAQVVKEAGEYDASYDTEQTGSSRAWFNHFKTVVLSTTFIHTCAVPFVVFAITLVMWTYLFMSLSWLCIAWSVGFLIAVAVIMFMKGRGFFYLPACICTILAIILGSAIGLLLYESYAIFPKLFANSRSYTNVSPSESSAAVADAGSIVFTSGSSLDIDRSIGYKDEQGTLYCVAPVQDRVAIPRYEFWAAGINCCSPTGDFHCDAAKTEGANGGAVIFDNHGWLADTRYDYYQLARAKAEAQYRIQSVAQPMYVRWVTNDNLSMLSSSYAWQAIMWILISLVCFLVLLVGVSYLLWEPPARAFEARKDF